MCLLRVLYCINERRVSFSTLRYFYQCAPRHKASIFKPSLPLPLRSGISPRPARLAGFFICLFQKRALPEQEGAPIIATGGANQATWKFQ